MTKRRLSIPFNPDRSGLACTFCKPGATDDDALKRRIV
jgi:hypothetical protein